MSLGKALVFILAVGVWPTHAAPVEPTAPFPPTISPAPPPVPDVTRGQTILLVANGDGIRLSAPGRALKDGKTGDIIPVINTATRIALKGVVREGWVEIPSLEETAP